MIKSLSLWRNSALFGLAILGVVSTVLAIAGISLYDLFSDIKWTSRLGIISITYVFIVLFILMFKICKGKKGVAFLIRGITVEIKQGDIFEANDWKLIPFNEYFDTQVDNIIISRSSLNGQFIDKVEKNGGLAALKDAIINECSSPFKGIEMDNGKVKYPMGCIKRFNEFMLLSFAHFDQQNEARSSWGEYEMCLRNMWKEIGRIYAGTPINLPLVGGGITRFDGNTEKPNMYLLRSMLWTLRTSDVQLNQPITILLTKKAMQEISLYNLKGEM